MRPHGSGTVDKYRGKFRARGATIPGTNTRPLLGFFATEDEAQAACDAHAVVTTEEGLACGAITLRALGKRYLDLRELGHAEGQNGPARGIQRDRSRWRCYIEKAPFIDEPVAVLSKAKIKSWLVGLAHQNAVDAPRARDPKKRRAVYHRKPRKLSAQTRKHALSLLRKSLDEAVEQGIIAVNPCKGVRPPKVEAAPFDYLSLAEQHAIERCDWRPARAGDDAALRGEADKLRAMFSYGTGLRQYDQWTLKLTDLRLGKRNPDIYFFCHKREMMMRAPLFGVALRAIRRWLEILPAYCPKKKNERGLVFPLPSGCQRQKGKQYGWAKLRAAAGIKRPVTWHELRDTCGSSLVSGVWGRAWRLEEVKEMLGHSSVQVTERYAHLAPGLLDRLASETREQSGFNLGSEPSPALPAPPKSPVKSGRARQDSDLRPTAPETRGKAGPALELEPAEPRVNPAAVALIQAQARGDLTAAVRIGLDLATALLEQARDSDAAAIPAGNVLRLPARRR
jgi:site-specific recombinase XerD